MIVCCFLPTDLCIPPMQSHLFSATILIKWIHQPNTQYDLYFDIFLFFEEVDEQSESEDDLDAYSEDETG